MTNFFFFWQFVYSDSRLEEVGAYIYIYIYSNH